MLFNMRGAKLERPEISGMDTFYYDVEKNKYNVII